MSYEIEELFEIIESEDRPSRKASEALANFERLTDGGDLDVAEGIAEVFAFSGSHRRGSRGLSAFFW
jgi:hypothetical protein